MGLETGTYISDLVSTNPVAADPKSQGDDHLRLLKATIKASFPAVSGAVTVSHTDLNTVTSKAPIASPTFTGTPAAPTAALGDSSTQLATTAFVAGTAFSSALPAQTGSGGKVLTTDGSTASWIYTAPTGSEIFWPTETAPDGWLEENGASLLRAGTYANLFAVIGTTYGAADGTHFNLPDSRGMFVRAWAHGTSNDPDKATRTAVTATGATMTAGDHVGTNQVDDFKAHTHTAVPTGGFMPANQGSGGTSSQVGGVTGSTGGNETRPLNTARMMIIKY